jgi:nitroreductase
MAIVKGSAARQAEHPIESLFVDRWSPRAMSGEAVSTADLMTLFEAARWAPSAGNTHPWRILYAHRDTEHWPVFFDLLVERNQKWCRNAAALLVFVSRTTNEETGKPLRTHSYDTGAAWENLALQGTRAGRAWHGGLRLRQGQGRVARARRFHGGGDGGRGEARPHRRSARGISGARVAERAAPGESAGVRRWT